MMKGLIRFLTVALVMFTIFFTTTLIKAEASGWGFRRNGEHLVPEIGKYQEILKGTNSYYVGSDPSSIYLTFDAGYDNGNLSGILDTLKEKEVKATFFVTGDFVKRFPELTLRLVQEGHAVANHSYSHKRMTSLSKDDLESDIKKLEDAFYNLTNTTMPAYFRPPEGDFDRRSLEYLTQMGYKTVFWSIAYKDWDTNNQKGADSCVKTIMDNLHDGAIILMHSVSSSNNEALPRVIDAIHEKGYTFKTVLDL